MNSLTSTHNQLTFFNAYLSFLFVKKTIVVIPGISGETINNCRRPVFFGSRALFEIGFLRYNNKSQMLLRVVTKIPVVLL